MMTAAALDIPEKWGRLFESHLPGYDPSATAGESDWFDADAAETAIGFFRDCMVFIEGGTEGSPFELEPWQAAIIGALFGWKRADGTRRYRESFIFVARKNGKTPLAAGIVLLTMFCDHEPGAQIYSAAAEREQAALVYRHAKGMIDREPEMASRCKTYKTFKSIEIPETNTIYKALSADADTKHGLNTHVAIVDELHAHPNRELVDVLTTSMGSRRQPLLIHITTADYDRESVCNEKHRYASRVRDGEIQDRAFLPVIYEASPEDDWTAPEVWEKANPNIDVSVSREFLERECKRAQDDPTYENTFKRLHLNIKTEQAERVIPMNHWDACPSDIDIEALKKRPCYGGLDLAQRNDLAALSLAFPPEDEDGVWSLLWWFWCPRDVVDQCERKHGMPYSQWISKGLVTATDGNDIDYGRIRRDVAKIASEFNVVDVGFDPYNATHLQQLLTDEDGIEMVSMRQGALTLNEPTKYLIGRVASRKLNHGGNPVARWMAANMAVKRDHADNIVPQKDKSHGKIDGIVASIMGIGRGMVSEPEQESVYETRGPLVF